MQKILVPTHNPEYRLWARVESPSDWLVIREIWCENVYEVFDGDLGDTHVVVDLGANIGAFSVYAGSLHDEALVIAVEPEPHNLELLKENIKQNGMEKKIKVEPVCITDVDGDETYITDEHGGSNQFDWQDKPYTRVKTLTLAGLLKKHKLEYVDVLKIDVEGAETDIILTASKDTMNLFRYITMEIDSRNDSMGKIVEKLSETHQVRIVGSHETGGQLYAKRY